MKKLEEMTQNEKKLRAIICDFRNEFIGGFINLLSDNGEEEGEKFWPLQHRTKQYVVDTIYNWVMNGTERYLQSSTRNIAIEKKHIKFMGEKFIRELIEDRVEYDYRHNGWAFPNNYDKVEEKTDKELAIEQLTSNIGKFYKFKNEKEVRYYQILKVSKRTVLFKQLYFDGTNIKEGKNHRYKLEGDIFVEMIVDKTATIIETLENEEVNNE